MRKVLLLLFFFVKNVISDADDGGDGDVDFAVALDDDNDVEGVYLY